jgi:hypothetical protein
LDYFSVHGARLLKSPNEPSDIGGRGGIATTMEVCSPAVNAVNPFASLSPRETLRAPSPIDALIGFSAFIANNGGGAERYVLEIGFQALFQILPTLIAVFPCDYVLGIGKPCVEPSAFAVQRRVTSECGGVPSSQLV